VTQPSRVGGDNSRQARHARALMDLLADRPVWEQVELVERRWKACPMPDEALYGIVGAMAGQRVEEEKRATSTCIACQQGVHRRIPCRSPETCACTVKGCLKSRG
jgi:hypothetical protein